MFWKGSVDSALIKHSTLQPSSFCQALSRLAASYLKSFSV